MNMRKINIEKELNKIQYGNRNKIILGIGLLLLIIAVGSTYALYQVRHTNKLVFNTVGKFKKKDIIISVKLDDKEESVDNFPQKEDGYVYSHMECEKNNITNITWDEEHWKLNADINGQDKCTVYFVKSPFHMKSCENKSMAECLLEEGQKFTDLLAFDDPDSNARYIGADPANYIWFNCDDYEDLTQEEAATKCEKWRIIGSFKNITIVDDKVDTNAPTKEILVKIIRADMIGNVAWNTEDTNYNWNESTLQQILNNIDKGYLNQNDTGDWIEKLKDKNYKSITSITNKNMIESIKWNIGETVGDSKKILASEFYNFERNQNVSVMQSANWNGKIALFYPSDYGYAVGGGKTNRNECITQPLYNWNINPYYENCVQNDWLKAGTGYWALLRGNDMLYVRSYDGAIQYNYHSSSAFAISPTLYLTHDTKISGGNGTYEKPYIITVQ